MPPKLQPRQIICPHCGSQRTHSRKCFANRAAEAFDLSTLLLLGHALLIRLFRCRSCSAIFVHLADGAPWGCGAAGLLKPKPSREG